LKNSRRCKTLAILAEAKEAKSPKSDRSVYATRHIRPSAVLEARISKFIISPRFRAMLSMPRWKLADNAADSREYKRLYRGKHDASGHRFPDSNRVYSAEMKQPGIN